MKRCLSSDALVDLLLDGRDASTEDATHAGVCPRCKAELAALRGVVQALHTARQEPMPEEWTERILARVEREAKTPAKAGRGPLGIAHSIRTLVLAFFTVLAAVLAFAPGGVGSPKGLFAYALSAGVIAAGLEILTGWKPDRWTLG